MEGIESVKKVIAKPPVFYQFMNVTVRGSNKTHINAPYVRASEAVKLSFFYYSEIFLGDLDLIQLFRRGTHSPPGGL